MKKKTEPKKVPEVDPDGFIQVVRGSKQKGKEVETGVSVDNVFAALNRIEDKGENSGGGENPLTVMTNVRGLNQGDKQRLI